MYTIQFYETMLITKSWKIECLKGLQDHFPTEEKYYYKTMEFNTTSFTANFTCNGRNNIYHFYY